MQNYKDTETETQRNRNTKTKRKKEENLVLTIEYVENADFYKPVLNKIITTRE